MPQDEQRVTQVRGSMKGLATRLVGLSGGAENIMECTHCTTRLRLRLRNSDLVDKERLNEISEVQGLFVRTGQLQIILGPEAVVKVTRQVNGLLEAAATSTPRRQKARNGFEAFSSKKCGTFSLLARLLEAVQFFSDIVVPVIPLFVGTGLLLGLLGLMGAMGWDDPGNIGFRALSLLTGSAFQLMAVLFGYHTAKRFGGTPVLGAAMGLIMTHPDFLELTGLVTEKASMRVPFMAPQFEHQGALIPTILSTLLLTFIEKGLRRRLPSWGAFPLASFISFAMAGGIAVLIIGPITFRLGGVFGGWLEQLFASSGALFGLLLGGIYSSIVIAGLHHGIQAVEAGLISNPDIGVNFLLPIWSMANVAQAGAGLAVYVGTRDTALRKVALPASITALFGITEPIVYGVNLKLGRPFLGAAAGGAVGGAYVAFHKVVSNSFGLTGIPMTAFVVRPGPMNLIHYLTGFLLALITAFCATWLLGTKQTFMHEGIAKRLGKRSGIGDDHENQKNTE
ncbi:negative regulator of SacY activity [Paenibacillus faecis]|uniref:PTS transporter subunit EIIC n=1 Tax=Paenibacillus faecis TaxID=862114 RepID=UPI001B143C3E|nr:PTS transporter subunit EIIC [Paenibacillus faecis]GIO87802.1 negative regulator of SacY activity [Paenibacillus faecis]